MYSCTREATWNEFLTKFIMAVHFDYNHVCNKPFFPAEVCFRWTNICCVKPEVKAFSHRAAPPRSIQQAEPAISARTECEREYCMSLSMSSGQLPPQMFY